MLRSKIAFLLSRKSKALAVSIVLHIVLLIILVLNFSNHQVPKPAGSKKETVKAYAVDAALVDNEIKKLKQAELDKQRSIKDEADRIAKQLQLEKQRLAEVKQQQKELELKKKQEQQEKQRNKVLAEKKQAAERIQAKKQKAEIEKAEKIKAQKAAAERKAELERAAEAKKQQELIAAEKMKQEKLAAEKRKQDEIEAERRREREELEMQQRMEEEEIKRAEHNAMLSSLRDQYVRLIEQKVERNWLRPSAINADYKCEVFVTQSVLGDVLNVRLGVCANDLVFRNSIERAVRKSSPLPPPPNPEVFDREIRFVFKPKV